MSTATAVSYQQPLNSFFDLPTEERSNALFSDMFKEKTKFRSAEIRERRSGIHVLKSTSCDTSGKNVIYSNTALIEDFPDVIALSEEWRRHQVGVQITKIRHCCADNVGEAVSRRLMYLRRCLKEEEGQNVDILFDSLQAARSFLELSGVRQIPDVSLTPEGEVYLRWKKGSDRMLAIHFLDDRNVRFALFLPNPRHARSVKRYSGHETVDTVLNSVDSLASARKWICQ